MNLISNAFKFTMQGGVRIQVSQIKENEYINVRVEDTGVGIEEKDQSKLFKEFGKLEKHSNLNPIGVGLGLNICKQIIEKLGGNISVESKINIGTTFTFSFNPHLAQNNLNPAEEKIVEEDKNELIPLHKKPSEIEYIREEEIISNRKLLIDKAPCVINVSPKAGCGCSKLLIVEDDFSLINIMANFAKKINIYADEANDGQDAINKVKIKMRSTCCRYYEIILIDFYMPIKNGIEAALEIDNLLSEEFLRNDTNIILVSGINEEEQSKIRNLRHSPFKSIEYKPISFSKFKELIRKFSHHTIKNE